MPGRHLLPHAHNLGRTHPHTLWSELSQQLKCQLELAVDWAQFVFPGVHRCSSLQGRWIAQEDTRPWAWRDCTGGGGVELRLAWGSGREGVWPPRGRQGQWEVSNHPPKNLSSGLKKIEGRENEANGGRQANSS